MRKVGAVQIEGVEYGLFYSEDNKSCYRYDLVAPAEMKSYSPVQGTNITASIITKNGVQHYSGQDVTILKIISEMDKAKIAGRAPKYNYQHDEDGQLAFHLERVDERLGMRYTQVSLNAKISKEEYVTPEMSLRFSKFFPNDNVMIPIDFKFYRQRGVVGGHFNIPTDTPYLPLSTLKVLYPEIANLEEKDYVIPTSYEQAVERLKHWTEFFQTEKAIDIETTGLDMVRDGKDKITSVLLGYVDGEREWSTLFPFRQEAFDYNLPIEFLEDIYDAVENQPKETKIIAHYGKMEIKGFYKELGKILRLDADTHALSVALYPKFVSGAHSLKALGSKYRNQTYLELENIFTSKKNIKFNVLPPEIARIYACPDVTTPIVIYREMMKELPKRMYKALENIEYPIIKVKALQEFEGLPMEYERVYKRLNEFDAAIDVVTTAIREACGYEEYVNVNSYVTKTDILYKKLQLPVKHWTNQNQPATSKVAIDYWLKQTRKTKEEIEESDAVYPDLVIDTTDEEGNPTNLVILKGDEVSKYRFPVLLLLKKLSELKKERGALNRLIDKSIEGRFMFYINSYGAETTRQTSDAHQFSDEMKKAVVPFNDEYNFWSCDFSQIELRVLPYLAGEESLIELEKDADNDVHRIILSKIQHREMWSISDDDRSKGKSVNFGIVYGKTAFGLAKDRKGLEYTKEDVAAAQKDIADFYNTFPNIKKFTVEQENYAEEHGEIYTQWGQRRLLPEVHSEILTPAQRASIRRKGANTPVQGFAAGIMKLVEIRLFNEFQRRWGGEILNINGKDCPKCHLLVSIHDEVLVCSHKSIPVDEMISIFVDCMDIKIKGAPPFFVEPAMINNWYDGKLSKYSIPIKLRDIIKEHWDTTHTSMINPDNYLQVIDDFKNNEITEYMNGLIEKYKTVEEIEKHVRHPKFTHTLIDVYANADKHAPHEEKIHQAVVRYLRHYNGQDMDTGQSLSDAIKEEPKENTTPVGYLQTSDGSEFSSYIQFNTDGDVFVEEDEDMDEGEVVELEEDPEATQEALNQASKAIYLMDSVYIDLSMVVCTEKNINAILDELKESLSTQYNNGYTVILNTALDKIIPTDVKILYNVEEVSRIVSKYEYKEKVDG